MWMCYLEQDNKATTMTSAKSGPVEWTGKASCQTGGAGGRRKTRRGCYTRFSAAEEAQLLEGVRKHGAGKWKKILNSYSFHRKRTAVDLKDKYRNMLRARERQKARCASPAAAALSSCERRVEAPSAMCLARLLCEPLQPTLAPTPPPPPPPPPQRP